MMDYHIHTPLCRHAHGELEEYINAAVQKGIKEIGFADHFPLKLLGINLETPISMEPEELAYYVDHVLRISRESTIPVKLGIEVDYLPGKTEEIAYILQEYPFDYVIGSVHFIGDWDCTHPHYRDEYHRRPLMEIYRDYFSLIIEACNSGLFDIIAHADAVKKFAHFLPEREVTPFYKKAAVALRRHQVCLELNTAGWDVDAGELYPAPAFLEECLQEGVEFTLGSDAHSPAQVGRHFDSLLNILVEKGVKRLTGFSGRSKYYCDLPEG